MNRSGKVSWDKRICVLTILVLACAAAMCAPRMLAGQELTAKQKRVAGHRGRAGRVQTGLDVLEAEKFAPLRGKRVGLVTNHTGLDAQGRTNIELLRHAPGVQLVALFSPEHGLMGVADEKVSSS